MAITSLDLEFTKTGAVFNPAQEEAIAANLPSFSDVIVVSHGWNNDVAEAKELYDDLFASIAGILPNKPQLAGKSFGAIRVFWPSKKFADDDLIPGGGASLDPADSDRALIHLLDELKRDPIHLGGDDIDLAQAARIDEAKAQIGQLDGSFEARATFVNRLREILNAAAAHPEDASDEFFSADPETIFTHFAQPVIAPPPAGSGGAAALGGAAGLRDLLSGARAAARRIANYVTYYQMKDRAGVVGQNGLGPVINRLHAIAPEVRWHLAGHSFGGRLVTAAAAALAPGVSAASMTLLQAAYSHNGLAKDFDGQGHNGFYRPVVDQAKVSGPIAITFTKNDKAVGIAYPLASRLAFQDAAALGDRNDPYGGMGRNGAQHTDEVDPTESLLADVGYTYQFKPGRIYNLLADEFISDHSEVTGVQVANMLLDAITVHAETDGQEAAALSGGEMPYEESALEPEPIGDQFARITAPKQLNDPKKRKRWNLPEDDETRGPYILELNLQHVGGLPGAISEFRQLVKEVVRGLNPDAEVPDPDRISKSYYRCDLSVAEWRKLLDEDEQQALKRAAGGGTPDQYRCIFRLWPDFPVRSQTYRSIPTIKGDAAIRSFDATGRGIVWAVIDSGVDATHPHFGRDQNDPNHTLYCKEVRDLHRCFVEVLDPATGRKKRLPDPDLEPAMDLDDPAKVQAETVKRNERVDEHRQTALNDEFGHGTHVAGIIAGQAPASGPESRVAGEAPAGGAEVKVRVVAFERQFKVNPRTERVESQFTRRTLDGSARLSGVAPRCRLVSLRVLDENGNGRSSDVIRALEYIREKINDDTRYMRVHGVNLSVGYEYDPEMFACGQSPLCAAVNRLVQAGVVVVAAAGNTGYGVVAAQVRAAQVGLSNTINDPGNAASAITVGSTHPERPYTYGVSYFSSKGPTGDGRLKPDLVAPGERILSCAAGKKLKAADHAVVQSPPAGGQPPPAEIIAEYIEDSGTSMSAPHVSGAVAAFLSIRVEFIGKPLDVKRIFLDSASPLGRERYFEGHGLLDVMRAIQSV
jgi:subtilisin family serine protease